MDMLVLRTYAMTLETVRRTRMRQRIVVGPAGCAMGW
jgi:hypothetical protein